MVYVRPADFDQSKTDEIAREIAQLNSKLGKDGNKYLLMAPGRWGSADKSRGIPVGWSDIDGASFIVETQVVSRWWLGGGEVVSRWWLGGGEVVSRW